MEKLSLLYQAIADISMPQQSDLATQETAGSDPIIIGAAISRDCCSVLSFEACLTFDAPLMNTLRNTKTPQ